MDEFTGKTIFLTGAGYGIGRTTALALAARGANLVLADHDLPAAEETAAAIKSSGGKCLALACDVSDGDAVAAAIARAVEEFGKLDGAFNNAGIAQDATSTVDCAEAEFDRLMQVNAKGVWLCLKHEIAAMLKTGGGAIVTNASLAGIRANPFTPAYIASKHAAVALSQGAAIEFGKQGIRVNCVCPGLIRTRMTAAFVQSLGDAGMDEDAMIHPGRWGDPAEVAEAVIWLLSSSASLVNGVAMPVDGGRYAA
jgi:NAD(P)-dependent dehydrogenase (short-subunit alcohol dehydrogenase family)